jgi:hypothetical protein
MRFTRFIAIAGAVVFALGALPAAQAAGPVFKCQGTGGKLTFSDQPCPNEQKQETVRAAPPPGQVDVDSVCGPASRPPANFSRKWGTCQQMRTCAENKGDASCRVYCEAFSGQESAFPRVKFGPASPSCLRYNDRLGGKNWVQTERRASGREGYEVIPASCVDNAGQITRPVYLVCDPGTTNCATDLPRRGRRMVPTPIDELMTKTCGT